MKGSVSKGSLATLCEPNPFTVAILKTLVCKMIPVETSKI